ncbi:MAG TPA: sulfotransferase, partial [Bryobacteraceae bacterium]|nr:sulfotransferase [Bryobacteraceae bacterium]
MEAAEAHFRAAIEIRPDFAEAHHHLGYLLATQGLFGEAAVHYRRTLAIKPDHVDAHNKLGNLLTFQGRFDEARAHYDRAIEIDPALTDAYLARAEIKTFHAGDADFAVLEALAGSNSLFPAKALAAHFALYKAYEDIEDYAPAFDHLTKGNALKRMQIDFDEQVSELFFRRMTSVFDRGLFERLGGEGDPSNSPIFVLGMPRSGSTLVEQILDSHPMIHGAGELRNLDVALQSVLKTLALSHPYPECVPELDGIAFRRIGQAYLVRQPVPEPGKVRIVDKLPGNFIAIGLIRLALPNARIIHTTRDPMDT